MAHHDKRPSNGFRSRSGHSGHVRAWALTISVENDPLPKSLPYDHVIGAQLGSTEEPSKRTWIGGGCAEVYAVSPAFRKPVIRRARSSSCI